MSKQGTGTSRQGAASKFAAAYWRARVYRNSYTRGGTTRRVQHWTVKIQHEGLRRTVSLRSRGRTAAAVEAASLYQAVVAHGWNVALAEGPRPAHPTPPSPLGMPASALRLPPEVTIGIHWSANPVAWTYFTARRGTESPVGTPATPRSNRLLSVALVEPDPHLARALQACLDAQPGFQCVIVLAQAIQALSWVKTNRVALLLANENLGDVSGVAFLDRLRHVTYAPPGLLYSVHANSDDLFRSTPGGAIGYLLKRTPGESPLEPLAGLPSNSWPDAAEVAARARAYFQQLSGSAPVPLPSLVLARLTTRELEILGLISQGFPDKEVASALHISGWTVHGHLKRIYGKLDVHSRTEAVVKYLQK
jgi:DNA-binding NarL/FixJ family response regulator